MIKIGMIGLGSMGSVHLSIYERLMKERDDIKLVAVCDVEEDKLSGKTKAGGNISERSDMDSLGNYSKYTSYKDMMANEELDMVDIAIPTYLHHEVSIYAMSQGLHAFCEKPMALNVQKCAQMIEASEKYNKKLMIGQCLRFWPEYELLKKYVDEKIFGNVTCGYFFRGGGSPGWNWNDWYKDANLSGGCLLDQHVHDIDMIYDLFGMPEAVSSIGSKNLYSTGYDAVSTNYIYDDKTINSQDDWTIDGDFGFTHLFRVTFENGSLHFNGNGVTVIPSKGEKFVDAIDSESAYYNEIVYFINAIANNTEIEKSNPSSVQNSIIIAHAEMKSADNKGKLIAL